MALSTCCYCISLKTGSLIIGILNLINCLISFIIVCMLSAVTKSFISENNQTTEIILASVKGCSAGLIVYIIFLTILTVTFIIGVVKKNHKLILPYLCVGFTNFLTIISIGIAFITVASTFPVENYKIWIYFTKYLFSSVIYIYFMMVVYYYYREVKSGKHNGVIVSPNVL